MRRMLFLSAALAFVSITSPLPAPAIDFFGSDDDEASESAFWESESGIPEAQPIGIPTSFADLAERVAPAVVSVQTKGTVRLDGPTFPGMPPGFGLPPWHRGDPFERKSEGEGSGFVISPDGYIVTNNHVVENSDEITVHFNDGSELPAEIVGLDPKTDVALLKVTPGSEGLVSIALGDSEAIRPGDWVVAIGNPFGFEHTVTAGIVSAKNRKQITPGSEQRYDDYIQTDAAINPGNSGGPLIDLQGRVVGINTLVQAGANTIGFSIPINQAKQILPQLRADGHVTRGWLGVSIQPVTKDLADAFDLDEPKGALVAMVMNDTPADDGGIESGDVIVEFDGHEIEDWQDLPMVVASTPVDKPAEVVLVRDGKTKTITIRTGRLDEGPQYASHQPKNGSAEAFGLLAQDVTPDLADRLGLGAVQGVIVTEVDPNSPAGEAGIRRGDVIVEIDRRPVENADALRDKLGDSDRPLLLVRRGESTLWVRLKPAG